MNIKKPLIITLSLLIMMGYASNCFAQEVPVKTSEPLKAQAVIIDVNSDRLEYTEGDSSFVATGNAEVVVKDQNSKLQANKISYDKDSNIITAEGNVKLIREGKVVRGSFARFDLNRETALLKDPSSTLAQIKIVAKTADIYPKNLKALDGKLTLNTQVNLSLSTSSSAGGASQSQPLKILPTAPDGTNSTPVDVSKKPAYKIVSKEVVINKHPDFDEIILKNSDIFVGKVKVATIAQFTLNTSEDNTTIDSSLPEVGYTREMGGYIGPGHVFYLPGNSSLKVAPLFAFGDGFGAGGLLRFNSSKNKTQIGFTSTKKKFVVDGEQKLWNKNTKLVYGSYSNVENGFFGQVKPHYIAEIVDERTALAQPLKELNTSLRIRTSAGYSQDNLKTLASFSEDSFPNQDEFGTMKFQLQATASNIKPIYKVGNYFQVGAIGQFATSVYGNGDRMGLFRVGPSIRSQVGPFRTSMWFLQGRSYGETPFYYDRYIQGKSNVGITSNLKLCKYLSIGQYSNIDVTKENYLKRYFTQNQVYMNIGPQDLKFKLGYDSVNKRSLFGIDVLLGSDQTAVYFNKLDYNQVDKN